MVLPSRFWEIQPSEEDEKRLEKEAYEKYISSNGEVEDELLPFE